MSTHADDVRNWYTEQLRSYYADYYRTAYGPGDQDASAFTNDAELGPPGPLADLSLLPLEVAQAHQFYQHHFEEQDLGSTRVSAIPVAGEVTYAIRVSTDGYDGYLEVYAADGTFLTAGRTYIELVAWGDRDWLRAQASGPPEHWGVPPELQDASERTLWGK